MSGVIFKSDLRKLKKVIQENPRNAAAAMDAAAQQMTNAIQLSFPPESPAPPGGPPGVDTNHLRPSIQWERVDAFTRKIHDGVEYGVYQEFGTDRGLAPRPFMTPMFQRWANLLEGFLAQYLGL
jgi:hypothetical protein